MTERDDVDAPSVLAGTAPADSGLRFSQGDRDRNAPGQAA
jgi:hypothetical protein